MAWQNICLGNLKQCSVALTMYANDYDGYLTAPFYNGHYWGRALSNFGYLTGNSRDVLMCPRNTTNKYSSAVASAIYGLNNENRGTGAAPSYYPGLGTHIKLFPLKTVSKKKASEFPLLADSVDPRNELTPRKNGKYYFSYPNKATNYGSVYCRRHNGIANVIFADGHAKGFTKGQLINEVGFLNDDSVVQ